MRFLIAAIAACIMLCAQVSAAEIPSAASGVYVGSDRVCRVVLARHQTLWIQLDLLCLRFDGGLSNSLTTLYAPGQCWNSTVSTPFSPQAWNEFLALRLYSASSDTLSVVIGPDQTAVANGIGHTETWARLAPVQSPAPYGCGSSVFSKPRG